MFLSKCFYNVYFFVGFMSYILSFTFFFIVNLLFLNFLFNHVSPMLL